MRDALIALVHGCTLENINFQLGKATVPITLASLSMSYIQNRWNKDHYEGYQLTHLYPLSEIQDVQTPKGLLTVGDVGLVLSYYIANYKGGRNECFMYGIDKTTTWYDYDLVSAYTTAMALLGDPYYKKLKHLTETELKTMNDDDILYSYIIIKTGFEFDSKIKYPSIPCFMDKDTTVYPLKGEAILTGAEYLVARNMGCKFTFKEIILIPFRTVKIEEGIKTLSYQPFKNCIKDLQSLRRKYKKGSVENL